MGTSWKRMAGPWWTVPAVAVVAGTLVVVTLVQGSLGATRVTLPGGVRVTLPSGTTRAHLAVTGVTGRAAGSPAGTTDVIVATDQPVIAQVVADGSPASSGSPSTASGPGGVDGGGTQGGGSGTTVPVGVTTTTEPGGGTTTTTVPSTTTVPTTVPPSTTTTTAPKKHKGGDDGPGDS